MLVLNKIDVINYLFKNYIYKEYKGTYNNTYKKGKRQKHRSHRQIRGIDGVESEVAAGMNEVFVQEWGGRGQSGGEPGNPSEVFEFLTAGSRDLVAVHAKTSPVDSRARSRKG
jgi:hypothetical protein